MFLHVAGTVTEELYRDQSLQELTVTVTDGDTRRAINYPPVTGRIFVGDLVLLNMTARKLQLGTGGYDFVVAKLPQPSRPINAYHAGPGHIIKGRYLPCQQAVLTLEEQEQYAAVWDKHLDGFPVIVGQLHSQIAPAAAALCLRGKRVAYIMTDATALPMAFSQLVRQLKGVHLVAATFTCEQAWGGDYETVTLHSALLAAKYIALCDVAIVCQGPGNAGTGTKYGFSGIEQAQNLDIAAALGGSPVALVRMSDADGRERHQGISHHTRTTLELVRSRVRVALPAGTDVPAGLAARHDICFANETQPALEELAARGITVTSMGRTPAQDPLFFASAAAAGMLA